MIIRKDIPSDLIEQRREEEMPPAKRPYYLDFIDQFAEYSKLQTRKLRLLIPPLCVYHNG